MQSRRRCGLDLSRACGTGRLSVFIRNIRRSRTVSLLISSTQNAAQIRPFFPLPFKQRGGTVQTLLTVQANMSVLKNKAGSAYSFTTSKWTTLNDMWQRGSNRSAGHLLARCLNFHSTNQKVVRSNPRMFPTAFNPSCAFFLAKFEQFQTIRFLCYTPDCALLCFFFMIWWSHTALTTISLSLFFLILKRFYMCMTSYLVKTLRDREHQLPHTPAHGWLAVIDGGKEWVCPAHSGPTKCFALLDLIWIGALISRCYLLFILFWSVYSSNFLEADNTFTCHLVNLL